MAKQSFVTGQVLTAQQVNDLQTNDFNQTVSAKTASYTLVAADKGTRITMSSTSATTITVNTGLFAAGDTLFIQNLNTGISTITAGTATVVTSASLALAQHEGGTLYFTSAGDATFFKAAGAAASGSSFSGARLTKSVGQTLTNNTDTMISWDVETFDVGGYHDNATNNSRITIPAGKAGYYQVSAILSYAANGTGQRIIQVAKNGVSFSYNLIVENGLSSNGYQTVVFSDIVYGAVADYFQIAGLQTSGGDLNVIGNNGDPGACYVSVSLIGA